MVGIKGRNVFMDGGSGSVPDSTALRFRVTFDQAPSTMPTITSPNLKYGKLSFIGLNWDDGSPGGLVARTSFQNLTYTDGCGNFIPYTGAIAFNNGFGVEGDQGYNPAYFQPPAMRDLVTTNWDLENHSMTHGGNNGDADPTIDTDDLDALMLLRVNYQCRCMVVPTNYVGYMHASYLLDYVSGTSQGDVTFDEFLPGTNRVLKTLDVTPAFMAMVREFYDEWDSAKSDSMWAIFAQEIIDLMAGPSVSTYRDHLIIGTHSPLDTDALKNGFIGLMTDVHTAANDRIMVASTRESLEYREMCRMPVTKVLTDNVLEVTVNINSLSHKNRWRDWCGNITSDATITNVELIEGIDRVSFNSSTGLVNVFKQKTVW